MASPPATVVKVTDPRGPDFTGLPDVAWVQILSYLTIRDRSSVAQTCHTLQSMFNHPTLWHTAKIILLGDHNRYSRGCGVIIPNRYLQMIKRFGAYFQDLTLVFTGYLHKIPEPCEEVIVELGKTCRLQSFTLAVGAVVSKESFYNIRPRKTDLEVLVTLVSNAFRLQEFNLQSWPMYRNTENVDILGALVNNPKLKNLTKLSLYWSSAKTTTWATLNAMLPPPKEMIKVVQHFTNLQCLSLRSTMLNENIILELATSNHVPLENLSILITFGRHDVREFVPEISSDAWNKLLERSPALKVHATIVTRMPFVELVSILKPEVPLASIEFMKYSACHSEEIQSVTDKYAMTLRKFVCYNDADNIDNDLITMVSKCKHLNYFVFHGNIHHSTVLALAKIKGSEWLHFQIMEDTMITKEDVPDLDDNVVLVRQEDGSYVTPAAFAYQQEEDREEKLFQLVKNVSLALQQKWFPVDQRTVDEGLLASTFLTVPSKYVEAVQVLYGSM